MDWVPDIIKWLLMGISVVGGVWFIFWLGTGDSSGGSEEGIDEIIDASVGVSSTSYKMPGGLFLANVFVIIVTVLGLFIYFYFVRRGAA